MSKRKYNYEVVVRRVKNVKNADIDQQTIYGGMLKSEARDIEKLLREHYCFGGENHPSVVK